MMIFLMIFTWRLSEAFLIPSSAAFWARASSSPAFALVFVNREDYGEHDLQFRFCTTG